MYFAPPNLKPGCGPGCRCFELDELTQDSCMLRRPQNKNTNTCNNTHCISKPRQLRCASAH